MTTLTLSDVSSLDIYLLGTGLTIIVPLLIKFIDSSFSHFWGYIFKQKKEYHWNETVLRNKIIKQSFDEYESIGSENDFWPFYLYLGSILGALVPVFIFYICLFFSAKIVDINFVANIANIDQLLSLMIPLFMLLSIFILIAVIINTYKRFENLEKEELIENYNKLANQIFTISAYILLYIVFSSIYFITVLKINFKLEEYFFLSAVLFLLNDSLLIFSLYSLYLKIKSYRGRIKVYINSKYGKRYPFIHVSTVGSNHANGQVKDIFNSKYLILSNNGTEEIILWSSIDLLKIQEYKIAEDYLQKSILEYK